MESSTVYSSRKLLRNCPLCGADEGEVLGDFYIEMFEDAPVSGDFSIVACQGCDFTFHDSKTTQDSFDAYYHQNDFNFSSGGKSVSTQFPNDGIRYEHIRQSISRYINSNAAIFDIGCAKGGQLSYLQQHGYTKLYGIDPSPLCIDYMKDSLGLQAEIGTATALPFQGVQADLIIYSHIIEHVVDLHTLVSAAWDKLNSGGLVFVEVPDSSRYCDFQNPPYCHLMFEHINHFDADSLGRLFCSHGFKLIEYRQTMSTFVTPWPVVWAIFRKESDVSTPYSPVRLRTAELLKRYLNWSTKHPLNVTLDRLASEKTAVYVWGVWQYAKQLLGMTSLRACNISGFIDRDEFKQGKRLLGHSIAAPDVLKNIGNDSAIVVAATNHQQQIVQELIEMGFCGTVVTLDGNEVRL